MNWILSSNSIIHFLIALFYTSITGSVVLFCVIFCYHALKKRDYIHICYRMLQITQCLFLIPIIYCFVLYLDKTHNIWNGTLFLQTPTFAKIVPWVIICWLIGFLITLIHELIPAFILYKQKKSLIPCETSIKNILFELCNSINISPNKIRLFQSYSAHVPFCIHAFHPVIIIPIQKYTNDELKTILIHELMHIRQKDTLFKYLSVIVKSLHFFNPCVWLLSSLMSQWSEYVCDNHSIKILGSSSMYFRTLVKYTISHNFDNRYMSALGHNFATTTSRLRRYIYYQKQTPGNALHLYPKLIPMIIMSTILTIGIMFFLTQTYTHLLNLTLNEKIETAQNIESNQFIRTEIDAEEIVTKDFTHTKDTPFYELDYSIKSNTLLLSEPIFFDTNNVPWFSIMSNVSDANLLFGLECQDGSQLLIDSGFAYSNILTIEESGYYKIFVYNAGEESIRFNCVLSLK